MRKIIVLSSLFFLVGAFASSGSITQPKPIPEKPVVTQPTTKPTPVKGLVILNDYYAVDENFVYAVNDAQNGWVKMPNADRVTITVIAGQFARDVDQIFVRGKKLEGADIDSFSVISGQHGYAQDDKHVYGPHGLIAEADTTTFKMLTKFYSADSGHVFYDGKLINANSGSFEVIDNGLYAVDDKSVFYAGKILKNTSPEGFVVKGPRAFTADGRTFFEGQVEKGDLPRDDEPVTPGEPVVTPETPATTNWFTPYSQYFAGKNIPFWSLTALALITLFSFLFVFFAERNDESVPFWKTLLKVLVSFVIGIVGYWVASFFLSTLTSQIIGLVLGFFFFMGLWSALGWIKSFLITVLSLIVFVFLLSLATIAARLFFHDIVSIFTFLARPEVRLLVLLKIVGIIAGTFLIFSQLGSNLIRAVGQAIVATLIALAILAFLMWLGHISTWVAVIVFALVYAALLWIMRFRMVSNLFAETVRIVRVVLIIAVAVGILAWIVL